LQTFKKLAKFGEIIFNKNKLEKEFDKLTLGNGMDKLKLTGQNLGRFTL
jgi:hypothetical protein